MRLLPVTEIFSALTTTTKSPTSTCGVYVGLRLPRSASAIWVANRPRVWPSASTSSQLRSRSAGVATYVFIARRRRSLAAEVGHDVGCEQLDGAQRLRERDVAKRQI